MVYDILRPSEEDNTACSRHRPMSGQSWIQLVHLASDAYSHMCGTAQSQMQGGEVTERHRTSKTSHGLVVWSNVTSLPGRRKRRPDQQRQLEEGRPVSRCLLKEAPLLICRQVAGGIDVLYPFWVHLWYRSSMRRKQKKKWRTLLCVPKLIIFTLGNSVWNTSSRTSSRVTSWCLSFLMYK